MRKKFHHLDDPSGYLDEEHMQGHADATGYWARLWCRALGLPHSSAWDQDIMVDPVTNHRSTMTAHERIQLLREEQALADACVKHSTTAAATDPTTSRNRSK